MLVDQHTGRIFPDRSWRDGLQQAVQAKEGVPILAEHLPLARISRQRYFRLYDGLCGLTGTAQGSEHELWEIYGLFVVKIPLRRPCLRKALATRYFASVDAKYRAIVAEIQRLHATGPPVLVGTSTIEGSELLARRLNAVNVPCCLLNGKQDADEAAIVARAGEVGTVTIATNMAGRGTDIRLGAGAAELGGLHVIGCERHESPRVDRQLAGRAARQGDPGSCQFFVSADDRLIFRHSPALARRIRRSAQTGGEAFADFSQGIVRAQRRAEHLQRSQRHELFVRDDWLEDVLAKLTAQDHAQTASYAWTSALPRGGGHGMAAEVTA